MIRPSPNAATLLYVDDEEMARKYFDRTFGGSYAVLTAASADAAIALLREKAGQIGIIITDYRMPGKSGADLLRLVAVEFPQVVRILVTAYAEREVLLDTVNSGEVFRILEKPLDAALLGETLVQAEDLLRMRNARNLKLQAIEETVAFLAHELNTPLAAIINYSSGMQQRLQNDSVSPRQQAELRSASAAVDDNARYCLSLLSSFIESVKDAGGTPSRPGVTSARQIVTSLLDAYPLKPGERDMILVEVDGDFTIDSLPDCVALVLSSLLGNALRALRGWSSPAITFTVSGRDTPFIRITDNGPGIPREVMDRLFVDPVTTHADSGANGLGMIFCKRIMQAFNGEIEVRSVQGLFTAITLSFPPSRTRSEITS
jgi:two-component system response regulator PhcR